MDAYQENPGSLDLNEDGTVGYVMLEGERSHQDSLIRTEWSVQTMRDGGIPLEKLTGGSANWDRSQAAALMEPVDPPVRGCDRGGDLQQR
ncbi:MAG: hypothetical protein ACLT76_02770 [Clostridium fessum]